MIGNVVADTLLPNITYFDAGNTKICDSTVVLHFPSLKVLNLCGTGITKIPKMDRFGSLEILNLSNTHIKEFENIIFRSDILHTQV